MKKTFIIAVFSVITISMASCSSDEEVFNTKQNFEIENLDYNDHVLKEGDTLFEGDPNPPKPKG